MTTNPPALRGHDRSSSRRRVRVVLDLLPWIAVLGILMSGPCEPGRRDAARTVAQAAPQGPR